MGTLFCICFKDTIYGVNGARTLFFVISFENAIYGVSLMLIGCNLLGARLEL